MQSIGLGPGPTSWKRTPVAPRAQPGPLAAAGPLPHAPQTHLPSRRVPLGSWGSLGRWQTPGCPWLPGTRSVSPLSTLLVPWAALEPLRERLVEPGCLWHEPPVEVHHSQEVLQLLDIGRCQVVRNGLDPPREWLDAAGGDAVAQEVQLWLPELHFSALAAKPAPCNRCRTSIRWALCSTSPLLKMKI
jgi:hypothetical protein